MTIFKKDTSIVFVHLSQIYHITHSFYNFLLSQRVWKTLMWIGPQCENVLHKQFLTFTKTTQMYSLAILMKCFLKENKLSEPWILFIFMMNNNFSSKPLYQLLYDDIRYHINYFKYMYTNNIPAQFFHYLLFYLQTFHCRTILFKSYIFITGFPSLPFRHFGCSDFLTSYASNR